LTLEKIERRKVMRPRSSSEQSVTHSEQRKDGRGQNPASQANLKPFPKGTSGNPSGRHKKSLEFIDALIEHGKKIGIRHQSSFTTGKEKLIDEGSYNFQVVDKVWEKARQGDLASVKLLHELGVLKPTTEEVKDDHENSRKYWEDFAEKIEERKVRRELEQAERFNVE
jgi:hypothetical protein